MNVKVLSGARFEAAENLREDAGLIMGKPEMGAWDVIFAPKGPT